MSEVIAPPDIDIKTTLLNKVSCRSLRIPVYDLNRESALKAGSTAEVP